MKVKLKSFWKWLRRWTLRAILAFFVLSFVWVLAYRWINPPITFLQVREWWNCPEGQEFTKDWQDLEDISFYMHLGSVSSEDQNFMDHYGIDVGAIKKAREYNKTHDKVRGASTITQQVAKNTFLWPGRSWVRKGMEVYFTGLVELLWGKQRILEVYLNVIEMGPCTFGSEAAARKYFNKSAADLTKGQAAYIVAAFPSPRKSNPGKPSTYLSRQQAHVVKQMNMLGKNYFKRHGDETWPMNKGK
ncbi:MAG: monofunctional biosynthetic peptidoglycan transglycosylase [Flavobacteriales bacterium]|jgi:monofunctional biosynthetic peptidoglycan transglycosylase